MKSKKKEPIKVGIIGFGGAGIAQYAHFTQDPNTEVTAIFDTKETGLKRAQERHPEVFFTDKLSDFLASNIDAVAICSPDKTHAEYVVAALDQGKHVFCEKPLADSLEGCQAILEAQKRNPHVTATVNHQMRFLPVHVEIKRRIEAGELGRIGYIEGYYVHNQTVRGHKYDDWRFEDKATPLVFSGCHFVDVLRWVLDDEVVEVSGMANNIGFPEYPESDLNVVLLRFRSGIIGKVVVAFGAGRPQDHSIRIYGSEKSIDNNLLFSPDGSYEVIARPSVPEDEASYQPRKYPFFKIRPYYHKKWVRDYIRDHRANWIGRLSEMLMRRVGKDREHGVFSYPLRLYPHRMSVRKSVQNFVAAINEGEEARCSLQEGAKTVVTCLAGVEAYRTGQMVKIDDYWLPEFNGKQT